MHNLKSSFDRFFNITKSVFENRIDCNDNFFPCRRKPKLSNCQIIAFAITSESLGIDSESFLWAKIKNEYADDFPNLIDRSNFNRRRKRLYSFIEQLNKSISSFLNVGEDCYLVDSIPIPVCKNAREQRSKICKENFETAPNKGYSAVNKTWYYGYKLHFCISASGVFHSMDLSKASIHDVHYLSQVKYSGLNNCTLLGDKGYLSSTQQIDLFSSCCVKLETPMRSNQKDYTLYPPIF
ncbi:MAG: IS982 family transposase, partial [Draconibacterium sp.]